MGNKSEILFVCVGDVGRSQMAEALFNKKQNSQSAISAGLKLSGPELPLRKLLPKTKEVINVMLEEGIDISNYHRKKLTEEMVNDADRIVLIIKENEIALPNFLINSPKLIHWSISDPKDRDLKFTRKVKDEIKKNINRLGKI